MSSPSDVPWHENEKVFLLAEIIKSAKPRPAVLLEFIRSRNLQPDWEEISTPPGRSVKSCRQAYDSMNTGGPMQYYGAGPAVPQTPTPLSAPPPQLKRHMPFDPTAYPASAGGREIRPKPAALSAAYQPTARTEPPPKRKRGRPTKAAAMAKAEAAAATVGSETSGQGGFSPGPSQASALASASTPTMAPASVPTTIMRRPPPAPSPMSLSAANTPPIAPARPAILPPTTRMPIAAMLTPTTREPKSAGASESESEIRRLERSTKSEPGSSSFTPAELSRDPRVYEPAYAPMSRFFEEVPPPPPPPPPPPSLPPLGPTLGYSREEQPLPRTAASPAQLRDQPIPPPPPPPDPPDPPDLRLRRPWTEPAEQPPRQ